MVAETNPNHVAMATGAFGDRSGIPGNAFAVYSDARRRRATADGDRRRRRTTRRRGEQTDGERATCVLAENFFAAVKRQTGGRASRRRASSASPSSPQIFASKRVDPKAYDATTCGRRATRSDASDFCDRGAPARPNDGYAVTDQQVMDEVVETVERGRRRRGRAAAAER